MILNSPYVTGSLTVTGNITASGGITISGSIASSSYAANAERVDGLDSTSFVFTSSYNTDSASVSTRVTKIEGNYATTGSNVFMGAQTVCANITSTGTIIAQTLNVQQVTSSIVYSSGSNIFGCLPSNVQQMTGSLRVTGSGPHYIQTGCVGIGTTTPSYDLHINNSSIPRIQLTNTATGTTTGDGLHIYQSGGDSYFINKEACSLLLGANNTVNVAITGSNVGIGASDPVKTLDVRGTLAISNNVSSYWYMDRDDSDGRFKILTDSNCEAFTITTNRNVGIGTATTVNKLDVRVSDCTAYSGTCTGNVLTIYNTCPVANGFAGIDFIAEPATGNAARAAISVIATGNGTADLAFGTRNSTMGERMRITSTGNVGIGTCDPQKPLELRTGGTSTTPANVFNGGISQVIVGGETQIAFSSNISPTLGNPTATELARAGIGFQYLSSAQPSEFSIGIQCVNTCGANVKIWNVCERIRITCTGDIRVNFNPGGSNGIYFQDVTNGAAMFYVIPATYVGSAPYNSNRFLAANSSNIAFETGGGERMRITSNGCIEIRNGSTVAGEIKPSGDDNDMTINGSRGQVKFEINGTEEYVMDSLQFYPTPDNTNALGTSALRWSVVYAANGTIQTSDRNEKTNITTSDLGLDYITKLKPVSYNWKQGDNKKHYGLIAQDVQELGIEFGGLNIENEKYGLNYSEFIAPLIKAIQEQHCTICTQALRINLLESCLGLT